MRAAETDEPQNFPTTKQADRDLRRNRIQIESPLGQCRTGADRAHGDPRHDTAPDPSVEDVLEQTDQPLRVALVARESPLLLKPMDLRDRQGGAQADLTRAQNAQDARMGNRQLGVPGCGGLDNVFHDELLQQ